MTLAPAVQTPNAIQLWQWITNPVKYLHNCDRQYGDAFSIQMSGLFKNALFISNPAAVQQLLTSDAKQFAAPGATNQILRPFLGDRGVILLDGLEHRQRRQLIMPAFHGDKIRVYASLIQQITRDVVAQWSVGETLNAREQMQSISLSVILQTVFGLYQGEKFDRIRTKLIAVLSLTDSPLKSSFVLVPKLQQDWGAWSPWGKFKRNLAELDKLLYQEIADRRRDYQPDRSDILNLLIGAQDADGQGMDDQDLRDELMTLLFAGHETTATALSWAIYWASYLPEVREKLLTEIATLGTARDGMAISKLPYLNAFCAEVLRIHPVAMLTFPRVAQEQVSLQGMDVAPGTVVMGCIYLTHHRPDLYPEPEKFKPERFIERQFSPYEYFPFGGGARRCIGLALAQLELKLVIVEVLTSCQLQLTDDLPIAPARRGVTLAPQTGVNIQVVKKYL
jgi:cytochrome P450 family 110